jgi:hypothetical protein
MLKDVPDLKVFLVGRTFLQTRKPQEYLTFSDAGELSEWLKDHPLSASYILIKGSHGIRLDGIINSID